MKMRLDFRKIIIFWNFSLLFMLWSLLKFVPNYGYANFNLPKPSSFSTEFKSMVNKSKVTSINSNLLEYSPISQHPNVYHPPYENDLLPPDDTNSSVNKPLINPGRAVIYIPVIGGADKIAFINDNEIWTINVDGSNLVQLTHDGLMKSHLHWSPDGERIIYINGKCLQTVDIISHQIETILCFEFTHQIETFEFSKEGQYIALIFDRKLYIVPYQPEKIKKVRDLSDLVNVSWCPFLSPLNHYGDVVEVKFIQWSNDNQRIAILTPGREDDNDLILLLNISQCNGVMKKIDEFPSKRFVISNKPNGNTIQNFTWDGEYLFVFSNVQNREGFGNLWLYDAAIHQAEIINPINRSCCYRDTQWSPDNRYLLFLFQNHRKSSPALFYVPFGTLDTSMRYAPLPLPKDFFTKPGDVAFLTLRPAK